MGYPSIFPTGTLIYNKDKTFNGYTVFPSAKGALLIDMNGREVQLWAGLGGFPNKILPGGYVMGTTGTRPGKKSVSGSDRSGSGRLGRQHRLEIR